MRNHPVTCLYFILKVLITAFLVWAIGFLLYSIVHGNIDDIVLLVVTFMRCLLGVYELIMVGQLLFYDVRNIVWGLPLPTAFFHTETDHGDAIYEVEANLCDEPVEYLAIFTRFGLKLTEITSFQPGCVYYSKTAEALLKKHPGAVTVHNHPGRDDIPFSSSDIHTAMRRGLSRTIVVTQDSVYEMVLPREFSEKEAARARKLMEKEAGWAHTSHERQIRVCQKIAAEFGMTFRRSARRD